MAQRRPNTLVARAWLIGAKQRQASGPRPMKSTGMAILAQSAQGAGAAHRTPTPKLSTAQAEKKTHDPQALACPRPSRQAWRASTPSNKEDTNGIGKLNTYSGTFVVMRVSLIRRASHAMR